MEAAVRKSNHGANVRRWREWRNINQDVLAEQIGVSQATLSSYEKKEKLDSEILDKLAKALEIPVEAITELEPETSINIFSGTFSAHDSVKEQIIGIKQVFNPMEKIIELYDEKVALYERMLKEKEEAISLLQEALKNKK